MCSEIPASNPNRLRLFTFFHISKPNIPATTDTWILMVYCFIHIIHIICSSDATCNVYVWNYLQAITNIQIALNTNMCTWTLYHGCIAPRCVWATYLNWVNHSKMHRREQCLAVRIHTMFKCHHQVFWMQSSHSGFVTMTRHDGVNIPNQSHCTLYPMYWW